MKERKGQMMLITAVVVSLMLITTGSAMAEVGQNTYNYRDEAYTINMIKDEASQVDKRFSKDRENYIKMVNSLESFTTSVKYSDAQRCFNVTLEDKYSSLSLRCIN